MDLAKLFKRLEKLLGSMKFAIWIIGIFTLIMIIATFVESFYSVDFVQRLIYKTPLFMLLQGLMFLSILVATLNRLPYKKRLIGFYILHSGLLLVFIGAFITYAAGLDGQISLNPGEPSNEVILGEDRLYLHNHSSKKTQQVALPSTAFAATMDEKLGPFKVLNYLPYADSAIIWQQGVQSAQTHYSSAHYRLFNQQTASDLYLDLRPKNNIPANTKMGPLSVAYYPQYMAKCFTPSGVAFLWNPELRSCQLLSQFKNIIKTEHKGVQSVTVSVGEKRLKFFPALSTYPLNKSLQKDLSTPFRLFDPSLFKKIPILMLFGDQVAFVKNGKWQRQDFNDSALALPWMNFKIELIKHSRSEILIDDYSYRAPKKVGGQEATVAKAVLIELDGQRQWVSNNSPAEFTHRGTRYSLALGKKKVILPLEITLQKFLMKKNPGTNNPASYESFVKVFSKEGTTPAHIYMNNPLKWDVFTLYQSSYFEAQGGQYGSILSVNFDPGRFLKYLGSLLFVLGCGIHFFLKNRKSKTKEMKTKTLLEHQYAATWSSL